MFSVIKFLGPKIFSFLNSRLVSYVLDELFYSTFKYGKMFLNSNLPPSVVDSFIFPRERYLGKLVLDKCYEGTNLGVGFHRMEGTPRHLIVFMIITLFIFFT